jgi:hypothetical protein
MKRASRLRREAKQLGRGRGVKSLPPVREAMDMKMRKSEKFTGNDCVERVTKREREKEGERANEGGRKTVREIGRVM